MAAYQLLYDINDRKQRVFRHFHPEYDRNETYDRFRFSPGGVNYIVDLIRPHLIRDTERNSALTPELQVQLALRFYASGSHLRLIGDTLGVHISSVSRAVRDVSVALCVVANHFISWPRQAEAIRKIQQNFYSVAGFPGVLGCVDGTHILIKGPSEHEHTYVNRKGFHSINVQGVCDDTGKFLNIVAKWPGSCHDSFIFRTSELGRTLEETHQGFADGIMLGDSSYGCRKYLLTPYLNPGTESQRNYNDSHTKTRAAIERCFGWWKRRFAVLHQEIRMTPDRAVNIIGACAVLHNIAINLKEPMDERPWIQEEDAIQAMENIADGRHVRDYVANTYF